jgi:hypothetical protein
MNQVLDAAKTRKLVLQTLSGAVVGALVTYFALKIGGGAADFEDPARLAAVAAGIVYALMGAFVGLGAIVPGAGAKFLNVEDADEIVEERRKFAPAAIACLLTSALLIALALTPGGDQPGALTRDMAALVAVAAFASLVVLGLWMRGQIDEFNHSLSTESSALALHVSLLLFGGWAALAHLGYVEWIAPLGLLAGYAMIQLAATFWVVGRRGLLMPR